MLIRYVPVQVKINHYIDLRNFNKNIYITVLTALPNFLISHTDFPKASKSQAISTLKYKINTFIDLTFKIIVSLR